MSGMLYSWVWIRPLLWLILLQANIWTLSLSWYRRKFNDFIVGKTLLPFSFEISMTKSDLLFEHMVAGLLSIYWVKLFYVAHGLIFFLFSGSFLHKKCVGCGWGFDLGDSASPARISRALRLHTLLSTCVLYYPLFYLNFTVVSSYHVSFSSVCNLD